MSSSPPTADAGGPYTTDEGTDVKLDGTGSTDPDNDMRRTPGISTATAPATTADGPTPDFTAVGQDGPDRSSCAYRCPRAHRRGHHHGHGRQHAAGDRRVREHAESENTTVTVSGTVTDPGWLDTLSGTISWGDGSPARALSGTSENERPDATFTFSASHIYGDNGTSRRRSAPRTTTRIRARRSTCRSTTRIRPRRSTVRSDTVNGTPTVIAHAGEEIDFGGRVDRPRQRRSESAGHGRRDSEASTDSLVNPPNSSRTRCPARASSRADDVSFPQAHAFARHASTKRRWRPPTTTGARTQHGQRDHRRQRSPNNPHGWWKQQFRHYVVGKARPSFTADELDCYLQIAGYMSLGVHRRDGGATSPRP